jgi:hypothetical protein
MARKTRSSSFKAKDDASASPEEERHLQHARDDANTKDSESIDSITQYIVTQVAPDELLLFSDISATYAKNPKSVRKLRTGNAKLMGFGEPREPDMLTPIIFFIVENALSQMAMDTVKQERTTFCQHLKRILFKQASHSQSDAPQDILSVIRNDAYKTAHDRFGIADTKAHLIADALKSKLASSQAEKENTQ